MASLESRSPSYASPFSMISFRQNKFSPSSYNEKDEPSKKSKHNDEEKVYFQLYLNYPLLHSMLSHESIRNKYFERETHYLREYPRSTDSWIRTLMVVRGRALDRIYVIWSIVTMNAIFWSIVLKHVETSIFDDYNRWQIMYSIVANSTLAFLLVFRLNRIAMRFWETRTMWGKILVNSRALVSSILIHGGHAPYSSDRAIAYVAAFAVSTKHYIRGEKFFPEDELMGILEPDELNRLERSPHSALYAANRVREHLKQVFLITNSTPVQYAASWSIQLQLLEMNLNSLLEQLGGMEKVRGTPLPLVYVSHLRSCLVIYLMTLPLVWVNIWGWSTVIIIGVTAFALLGVEAAASECEIPFDKNRTNHLELDSYCYMVIKSIQQLLKDNADTLIERNNDLEAGDSSAFENIFHHNVLQGGSLLNDNYREPWNGFNDQVSILVDEYPPISEESEIVTHHKLREKFFSVDGGSRFQTRRRFLT